MGFFIFSTENYKKTAC